MDIGEYVGERGGFVDRAALVAAHGAEAVDASLVGGEIVVAGRRRYALPGITEASRVAIGLSGCSR